MEDTGMLAELKTPPFVVHLLVHLPSETVMQTKDQRLGGSDTAAS